MRKIGQHFWCATFCATRVSGNKNGIFYVIYKPMQKVRVFLAQTGILAANPEKFPVEIFQDPGPRRGCGMICKQLVWLEPGILSLKKLP